MPLYTQEELASAHDLTFAHKVGEQLGRALRVPTIGWQELNLENNDLGKDGVNPIFWALRRNVSLTSLDLSNNHIGPQFGKGQ